MSGIDPYFGVLPPEIARILAGLPAEDAATLGVALLRGLAAEERVTEMAGVPCVTEWKSRPMKCLLTDPCSFCRCRAMIARTMVREANETTKRRR